MKLFAKSLAIVLLLAVSAVMAPADTIDQSFLTPTSSLFGASCVGCTLGVAQTFTAGLSGQLTGITFIGDLGFGTGPFHLSINTVSGGAPTTTELGSVDLTGPFVSYGATDIIALSGITVAAGTQYAIVFHWPTDTNFFWNGSFGDLYTGGSIFQSQDNLNGGQFFASVPGGDLNFQTYVQTNPVPEPTSLVLLASGLAGFWWRRKR